jgi:hypothetical protein
LVLTDGDDGGDEGFLELLELDVELEALLNSDSETDVTFDSEHPVDINAAMPGEVEPVMTMMNAAESQQNHVVIHPRRAARTAPASPALESVDDSETRSLVSAGSKGRVAWTSTIPGAGCGSTYSSWIVPDWNMKDACIKHDSCYDTCGKKKTDCDSQFLANMRALCAEKYKATTLLSKAGRAVCNKQAVLYHAAVAKLGNGPWTSAQNAQKCPI